MRATRQSRQLAHQLYRLSLDGDLVSAERVGAVLGYLERHPPRQPLAVLRDYRRLVARHLARSQAVVEHAGVVSDDILRALAEALTRRYERRITATARLDPELIAGLRIRVGDDVYESSIAGHLAALLAGA